MKRSGNICKRKSTDLQTEHQEQASLIQWCNLESRRIPALDMLFAIANGTRCSIRTAIKAKQEGVKRGVPDLFLPVPRHGYHGLFLEMKRIKGGTISDHQKVWIQALQQQGYAVHVAHGAAAAIEIILNYLRS